MSKQSMQALAYANEIRCEGARLRREMNAMPFAESRFRAVELLLDPPEAIQHMRVQHFLLGIRRVGVRRVPKLVNRALLRDGAAEYVIGPAEDMVGRHALTEGERRRLAEALVKALV
jgi:hypothetical protein